MKSFFLSLLSSEQGSVSCKRFIALWCLVLFSVEVMFHLITKMSVQGEIILATVSLITVPLGLSVAQSIKALNSKTDVAQSIVEQDASIENTQAAQATLKDDKPKE